VLLVLNSVEVELPVAVFVLDPPLNDALVGHGRGHNYFVFKYFDRLDHGSVPAETPRRSHFGLLQQIEFEVSDLSSVDGERVKPKDIESACMAAADGIRLQTEPSNSRHKRKFTEQHLALLNLILTVYFLALVPGIYSRRHRPVWPRGFLERFEIREQLVRRYIPNNKDVVLPELVCLRIDSQLVIHLLQAQLQIAIAVRKVHLSYC
jgi:hypothetical protein